MSLSVSDEKLFHYTLISLYLAAPPTLIALKYLQAPYGKHNRPGWGPTIYPPLAWFIMESPTLWLTLILFPFGRHFTNPKAFILMSPFLFHYFHRTVIYPLKLHRNSGGGGRGFPASIAIIAFVFNLMNGYLQARWVSNYKEDYDDGWFWIRFFMGLVVFVLGMWVNVWADRVLLRLKREGGGYKIPRGGLYGFVSCPNYFGEIMEWFGWGVMTWSWVGFGFCVYTFANLGPRGVANHKWYLEKFRDDYPRERKAVIPFLY